MNIYYVNNYKKHNNIIILNLSVYIENVNLSLNIMAILIFFIFTKHIKSFKYLIYKNCKLLSYYQIS